MFDSNFQISKGMFLQRMNRMVVITLFSLFLILLFTNISFSCEWCPRKANIEAYTHPDYIIELNEFADRIGEFVSNGCFTVSDSKPEYTLGFVLTVFDEPGGKYLSDIIDGKVVPNVHGPYFSECKVTLYYIGGEVSGGGLVNNPSRGYVIQYWRTHSSDSTATSHEQEMMGLIRESMPFDELVWNWEKTPGKIDLETDNLCIQSKDRDISIKIKNLKDIYNRECSIEDFNRDPLNRMVFVIDQGKLSEEWYGVKKINDGEYAMQVSNCFPKLDYSAPEDPLFNEITIEAYNSCQILKTEIEDLIKTPKKNKIGEIKLRNFNRLPYDCDIKVPNNEVIKGKSVEILIKNLNDTFMDPVKPYDRIFVGVKKGEITNGKKLAGMHAFDVGNSGVIKVKYQAPDDCDIGKETIVVHTSCSTSDSSAVEPLEEIKSKKFDIVCEYKWSGTLQIEQTKRFNCDLDETEDNINNFLSEKVIKSQKATLQIYSGDFSIGESGVAVQITDDMRASGSVNCELSEDKSNGNKHLFTTCGIGDESHNVSPGNWSTSESNLEGSASCPITQDNLVILISKKVDMDQMESLADQITQGGFDPSKIAELAGQMEAMMNPGDETNINLQVEVQLNVICEGMVTGMSSRESYQACPGRSDSDSDSEGPYKAVLGKPLIFDMDGSHIKGEDGNDQLTASFSKTRTSTTGDGDRGFESECPKMQITERCILNLYRVPDN